MWRALMLMVLLVVPPGAPKDDCNHERPIDLAQNEADRGTGRVVDDATHEIDRMQTPHRRTTEEILADEDRRQRIERQQQRKSQSTTAPGMPLERHGSAALGGEMIGQDVSGGERLELMADVLAALDEHDRQVAEAHQKLSADPQSMKRRELELQDAFARKLAGILDGYEIQRSIATRPAPSTQPAAAPTPRTSPPTTRQSDRESSPPIRLPAPVQR